VSSPADDLVEASRTLLRKAHGDAAAARELAGNQDIPDEIIASMPNKRVSLATQGDTEPPVDADALIALTQYSVPLRYEDLLDAEPLDRGSTIALVDEVGRWAEAEQKGAGSGR
jgi:hypothetical protein